MKRLRIGVPSRVLIAAVAILSCLFVFGGSAIAFSGDDTPTLLPGATPKEGDEAAEARLRGLTSRPRTIAPPATIRSTSATRASCVALPRELRASSRAMRRATARTRSLESGRASGRTRSSPPPVATVPSMRSAAASARWRSARRTASSSSAARRVRSRRWTRAPEHGCRGQATRKPRRSVRSRSRRPTTRSSMPGRGEGALSGRQPGSRGSAARGPRRAGRTTATAGGCRARSTSPRRGGLVDRAALGQRHEPAFVVLGVLAVPEVVTRLDVGTSAKLYSGGGDGIDHSSVRPSHGSSPATAPRLAL